MARQHKLIGMYQKLAKRPLGKQLFSRIVAHNAPYFKTIHSTFLHVEPGHVEVSLPNRRSVHNHIGTVHAIAMCNACELAGGFMTEVSIPTSHRWIPRGMTVKYIKKAETDLRAVAKLDLPTEWPEKMSLVTPVDVLNAQDEVVMSAEIEMWVTQKSAS